MTEKLTTNELQAITTATLNHYGTRAHAFWEGTKDHDVQQNYMAFLGAMTPGK